MYFLEINFNEASVLAKSRSEEESQKLEDLTLKYQEEWVVVLQEHPLTQEHSLEKYGLKRLLGLGFLHKDLFIEKLLPLKCPKGSLRDDRLHASLCVMTCSLMILKPMNKPKPKYLLATHIGNNP